MKLDREMVFMKFRQKAIPRRSCRIQIHLQEQKTASEPGPGQGALVHLLMTTSL